MNVKDYLVVDRFLKTETDAASLKFALESGLIDRLESGSCSFDDVPVRNPMGRRMLVDLLLANGVITCAQDAHMELASDFRAALQFRDLIESKLTFGASVCRDVSHHFGELLDDLPRFMAVSSTFELFRYDRCFQATRENLAATQKWMTYTTSLTRYEGRVLAAHLELPEVRVALDLGGNSGELALQLCAIHTGLSVTVFDLPVVCILGERHVATRDGGDRIRFQAGDMRRDRLPTGVDLVTIKSLLHDWPDDDAVAILEKAAMSLRPGGRLVIFERAPLRATGGMPYSQLANLVFFHFFRPPQLYVKTLERLGFDRIDVEPIELETTFHVVSAYKPSAPRSVAS